jgi:hypothetical protein
MSLGSHPSAFEDTRREAERFGARGTTVKAYKPRR